MKHYQNPIADVLVAEQADILTVSEADLNLPDDIVADRF